MVRRVKRLATSGRRRRWICMIASLGLVVDAGGGGEEEEEEEERERERRS